MARPTDQEIDRVFSKALELSADSRQAYLERTCSDQPELLAAVEDLLRNAETQDDLLDAGAQYKTQWLREAETVFHTGNEDQRIGPWRLVREIGRGGMGVVYLAERADGEYRQQAALKLVRLDGGAHRRERFARERQILADLDHPGIARLLDGGVSNNGWPYLVMEYVNGQPIDQYSDDNGLPLQDRLHLFLEVCAAVDAAHRQLVVHRDIKPSNILVTDEAKRQPKLLDFGIAKLVGNERPSAEFTQDEARVMTPAFASPEQFRGDVVTVASDVYQLGLLLFRLLTGQYPHNFQGMSETSVEELICEVPAPRPSATVPRDDKRRRQLQGDLDTITTKSLAKEPAARYPSVAALAADLKRHLHGQPIAARPPAWGYRAGKFVARHRFAVTLITLALAFGILQTLAYTVRLKTERDRAEIARQEAEQARDEARQLTHFLIDVFEINDPDRSPEDPVDVMALMERATEELDEDLPPLVRARFLHTSGEIYSKLARFDQATEILEEALTIRRRDLPPHHPEVIDSVVELGVAYSRLRRVDEAETLLTEALEAQRAAGEKGNRLASALNNLGNLHYRTGDLLKAQELYRDALEIREKVLASDDPELNDSINNYGVALFSLGRHEEAIPFLTRAAELYQLNYGDDHPSRATALNNLSLAENALGQFSAADQHLRAAREIWLRVYGPEHPHTLHASQNLGGLLRRQARLDEAVETLRDVLDIQRNAPAQQPLEIARTLSLLGAIYIEKGDLTQAGDVLDEALTIRREALGFDHRLTLSVRSSLAELEFQRGRLPEAEASHREILALKEEIYGREHRSVALTLHQLALVVDAQGRRPEARKLLENALEIRLEQHGEEHPDTQRTRDALASLEGRNDD